MRIYEFVREHVIPFNSVIAMAVTVAAVTDFLAPQAPYLAWLSYALATMVLLAMVLEVRAQRPGVAGGAWYMRLLGRLRAPPGPLWKSPAWQVIGIITAIALVLGQASKARADSGGLIASAAPNLRNVQLLLLGLKEDARRIQAVLDGVDTKVDSIHASMGNMEAALTKDPLEALMEGDYPFLKSGLPSKKVAATGGAAAELAAGKQLFDATCSSCHGLGAQGYRQLHVPALRGLDGAYIRQQLDSFAKGWRGDPDKSDQPAVWMRSIATHLSQAKELEQVLQYIARLPAQNAKK